LADFFIRREVLEAVFGQRWGSAFESQQKVLADVQAATVQTVADTQALNDATFVTLSANAELPNERVLQIGEGLEMEIGADYVILRTSNDTARTSGDFRVTLIATGDTAVAVPLSGTLATRENAELLANKTLAAPKFTGLVNAADDVAAAGAGVPIGGAYLTGSAFKVRVA